MTGPDEIDFPHLIAYLDQLREARHRSDPHVLAERRRQIMGKLRELDTRGRWTDSFSMAEQELRGAERNLPEPARRNLDAACLSLRCVARNLGTTE